jgi:hypothetical protein
LHIGRKLICCGGQATHRHCGCGGCDEACTAKDGCSDKGDLEFAHWTFLLFRDF